MRTSAGQIRKRGKQMAFVHTRNTVLETRKGCERFGTFPKNRNGETDMHIR